MCHGVSALTQIWASVGWPMAPLRMRSALAAIPALQRGDGALLPRRDGDVDDGDCGIGQ